MTESVMDIVQKTDDSGDHREEFPDFGLIVKKKLQKCDSSFIKHRLPILTWLPNYRLNLLFADFVAGLTVGLTAIPQGIAYAVIAGLEPQYGLYSGFVGCFVYLIFGSCKDITIGPTAIMALMVQRYVSASPDLAVLATFLSGLVIFLLSLLNLGFIVQFISFPVTVGFTTAAAITIASGQLKSFFGLTSGSSNEFLESWENWFEHFDEIKLWDTVLGVSTLIILLVLKQLSTVKGKSEVFCKYISLSRNAIAVIGGLGLAYFLTTDNKSPFILTGKIASGFPDIKPPPFETIVEGEKINFAGMLSELGSSIIALPLISILESIAIAKAFSKGKVVDATQEMFALGLCNIIGSFFSSMPTTGSFTRTAINNSSGVRTTLGGIFTGGIVLLALGLLTGTFFYIPKTTLAAVIIAAMIFMVEYEAAIEIWKTKRMDIIPFGVTILACLFLGLEYGILCGVAVNVMFILYTTSRPNSDINVISVNDKEVLFITPDQTLIYSAAEYIRAIILKSALKSKSTNLIVVNGSFVHTIDTTVAKNLKSVVDDIVAQEKYIIFWNWKKSPENTAWRLDEEFGKLFRTTETLEELIDVLISENYKLINV